MFGWLAEKAQEVQASRPPNNPPVKPPTRSDSELAVTLNGEATAVGENTAAHANLFSRAYDRGAVQVAFGGASLASVARSSAGELAFAATNGFVEFAGADYSFTSTQKQFGGGETQAGAWSVEQSRTDFVALNIVGWNVPLGTDERYAEASAGAGDQIPLVSGNLASYQIDAKGYGDDSFVHADSTSLTIDGFSSSSNSVVVGVGSGRVEAKPIFGSSRSDMIFSTNADTFIDSGKGNDLVTAGKGDDWIVSGDGHDVVFTGCGNNTVLAGDGNDSVTAGGGDDWVFGGDGKDMISVGDGNNIVNGGEGNDTIIAGSGDDVIIGGRGKDMISTGAGRNLIRMGLGTAESDGDDTFTTGRGHDLFFLDGSFGSDEIWGFSTRQGDRLVVWDDYGAPASLARSKSDPQDLVVTLGSHRTASTLTLEGFFLCNPGYASPFLKAPLTKAQEVAIRQDVFLNGPDDQLADVAGEYFAISDYLGFLG